MWQIMWAHPEFGQVLATCSFDNTAATWEEQSKKCNDYLSTKEYFDSPIERPAFSNPFGSIPDFLIVLWLMPDHFTH